MHTKTEVMKMNEQKKKPSQKMPAGTPWSSKEAPTSDPVHPPVSDPPVPNRAHTELRADFPPELPQTDQREI